VGTQARTRARGVAGMEVAAWNRRTGVGAAGERKGRDLKGMNASSSFGRADGGGGRGRLCVSILRELPTRKVNRGLSRRGGPGMMLRSVGKRARGRRGFSGSFIPTARSLARPQRKTNENGRRKAHGYGRPGVLCPSPDRPARRGRGATGLEAGGGGQGTKEGGERRNARRCALAPPPPSPSHALSHPTPPSQRFAFRLATDPASKAALQAEIVAAYTAHGRRG